MKRSLLICSTLLLSLSVPAFADEPPAEPGVLVSQPIVEHIDGDAQTDDADEASTTQVAYVEPTHEPTSDLESVGLVYYRRPLMRMGGHARDGYNDILVPEPLDLPYTEIVNPERYVPGSMSMGDTSDGRLDSAALLPLESDTHFVLPAHRERPTHYGTDELVAVILDTAQRLQEVAPGPRVAVGNMSAEPGGDIRWSRSHNSGRDIDVAFFMHDSEGQQVEVDDLIVISRGLSARDDTGRTFDIARNWQFMETLLTSDRAQIQWVFVYEPLRQAMLEHAVDIGADPEVVAMASEVMHQPSDSARHDDHFHIRVYCSREDRLEGCINWGPRRNYADYYEDDMERRVLELLRGLMDPNPQTATASIDFLEMLQPRESAFVIASAIPHQTQDVQMSLMDLVADLDQPGVSGPLIPLAESHPSDSVRSRVFWLLGRLADPESAPGIAGLMVRDFAPLEDGTSQREAAATALRNIYNPTIVPALITSLDDPSPSVRAAVSKVLERTTGLASPTLPQADLDEAEVEELVAYWADWYALSLVRTQDEWWSEALTERGFAVGDLADSPRLAELVRALDCDEPHIQFIADRLLNLNTRHWTPSESWSQDRRVEFWQEQIAFDD